MNIGNKPRHIKQGATESRFAYGPDRMKVKQMRSNPSGGEVLHNDNPKPFIWTSKANDILGKVVSGQ